jgi:hypothetical protein
MGAAQDFLNIFAALPVQVRALAETFCALKMNSSLLAWSKVHRHLQQSCRRL